jgi:quercetin dioxygenase-like cupin family protein
VSETRVIGLDELPATATARELVGADHGGAGVCLIFLDAPPGHGPSLHRHPYEEIFVVQEGEATFTADGEERVVRAGEIVIVPAGVAHGFVNSGDGPLRQLDIHVSPRFDTEWL